MLSIKEVINSFENKQSLDFDESFKYAQYCSYLLKSDSDKGRELLIYSLAYWSKLPDETREIWSDLVELAGFYPYTVKGEIKDYFKSFTGQIRKGIYQSEFLAGKYLHEAQKELLGILNSEKNLIVSAPTSFGKSLLIEEVVASNRYKNIVVIQPTLALIDETRKKLLKYTDSYNLVVRTSQMASEEKGNIFLFTAERVCEYGQFPHVEFLVIDEFYKLSGSRDDERSSSLNNAFHYLLKKFNPKFYLLGPNIDYISEGFAEFYNAEFYKSEFSLVAAKVKDIYKEYEGKFGERGKKKLFKEQVLFELLYDLRSEQTIVYCSSPGRVRYLSKEYLKFLINKGSSTNRQDEIPLIQWIEENIDIGWSLQDSLINKIGIHDGALQKHITSSIIEYFNTRKLNWLFCTSTIIEGVNTSAKNIIYFDENKGPNPVDFFDYSNIKGRAGRMMEHFIGNIYNFNPPPKNEKIIIDIPFFQQSPIKDEVLIQLDDNEVKNRDTEQYSKLRDIPQQEKEIIKKNAVKVTGQLDLLRVLRTDIDAKRDLIQWDDYPRYPQLTYVLSIAYNHLLLESESKNITLKYLVNRTFNYGMNKSIRELIMADFNYKKESLEKRGRSFNEKDVMDDAIKDVFQLIRHWFQYKIPKMLSVVNELQKFVCLERGLRPGNYTFYANLIENDFLRDNLAILFEYGIPSSAIRKLENLIPRNIPEDRVLNYIKQNNIQNTNSLIQYERNKISENL